jgi:hypothetical protein
MMMRGVTHGSQSGRCTASRLTSSARAGCHWRAARNGAFRSAWRALSPTRSPSRIGVHRLESSASPHLVPVIGETVVAAMDAASVARGGGGGGVPLTL